jgi:hypothetical protein
MSLTPEQESLNNRIALAILALDDARHALGELADEAIMRRRSAAQRAWILKHRDQLSVIAGTLDAWRPEGIITRRKAP